jgi:hypothetical protein
VPKIEKDEKINFAADTRGLTQTWLFPPPTWRRKICSPSGQELEVAPAAFLVLKVLFSIAQRLHVFRPAGRWAERPSEQKLAFSRRLRRSARVCGQKMKFDFLFLEPCTLRRAPFFQD